MSEPPDTKQAAPRHGVGPDAVEGLRNPPVAREERIRKLLPLQLTPFDEAARRALALSSAGASLAR